MNSSMSQSTSPDEEIKVIFLGDKGVGKRSLLELFIYAPFVSDYDPTIEDSHRKNLTINDKKNVIIDIVDPRSSELLENQDVNIVIIVYDTTQRTTFDNVSTYIESVDKALKGKLNDSVLLCIFGNKCDMSDSRQVTKQQGQLMSDKNNGYFKETSAKSFVEIDEVFIDCVRKYYAMKGNMIAKSNKANQLSDQVHAGHCCIIF